MPIHPFLHAREIGQRSTIAESGGNGPGGGRGGGVHAITVSRAPSTLVSAIVIVWSPALSRGDPGIPATGVGGPGYRSASTRMLNSKRNRAASQRNSAQSNVARSALHDPLEASSVFD